MKMMRQYGTRMAAMSKTLDAVKQKAGPILAGMKIAEAAKKREEHEAKINEETKKW